MQVTGAVQKHEVAKHSERDLGTKQKQLRERAVHFGKKIVELYSCLCFVFTKINK